MKSYENDRMIILMRSIKTECVEQAEKLWLKTKMTMQNIETPNTHARRYRCTENCWETQ